MGYGIVKEVCNCVDFGEASKAYASISFSVSTNLDVALSATTPAPMYPPPRSP